MGRISLFLAIGYLYALIPSAMASHPPEDHLCGSITKIVDGDTVWIEPSKKKCPRNQLVEDRRLKIRMVGIDAPETHLPTENFGVVGQGRFGEKATKKLAQLAPIFQAIEYNDFGKDKFNRTLSRLFRNDNDVNYQMIESGWAIPYIICEGNRCDEDFFEDENVEQYISVCEEARATGLGVFDPKDPLKEMPFEFRLRMQKRKPDKWVGDFYTKRLYHPDQYKKVDVCRRIFFLHRHDAERLGFRVKNQ